MLGYPWLPHDPLGKRMGVLCAAVDAINSQYDISRLDQVMERRAFVALWIRKERDTFVVNFIEKRYVACTTGEMTHTLQTIGPSLEEEITMPSGPGGAHTW